MNRLPNQGAHMSLRILTTVALLAGLGAAAPASALSPQEEASFKQNCTNDYMRFCSMFDPNTPQVEQCFQQRMKELSPRCQAAIASYTKANPGGGRR
jgi:hypothetical protein